VRKTATTRIVYIRILVEKKTQESPSRKGGLLVTGGNLFHFIKTVLHSKVKSFWQFLAVIQIFFL